MKLCLALGTDNRKMRFLIHRLRQLPPPTIGLLAAVITVSIWSAFIVIARASASGHLLPLDIAWARIMGASIVLLPWAWWLSRQTPERPSGSFGGLSPLPFRTTVIVGLFGGLSYSMFAYSGFFFAPAAHGSVLMPGFLPVWTSLLALALLGERLHGNRLMGLALIISGGMLVGGSSMLHAFDGGSLWLGDVLFLCASFCWSTYSVLSRRFNLQAIRHHRHHLFCVFQFCAALHLAGLATRCAQSFVHRACLRSLVASAVSRRRFGGHFGHHLHPNDPPLWARALDHDHLLGARLVGFGGGGVFR
jgi:drug/metabolite transporter (DMT)-like permease